MTVKKIPGVLIDNGKDAKACQISQEVCQFCNRTHDQYVEQFKDMLKHRVVSEITQQEISAYTGPVNYIT